MDSSSDLLYNSIWRNKMDKDTVIRAMNQIEKLLSEAEERSKGSDILHELNNARQIAAALKMMAELD